MTADWNDLLPTFQELDRVADDAPGREQLLAAVGVRYHRSVARRRYYALSSAAVAVLLVAGTAAALAPTHSATPSAPQTVTANPSLSWSTQTSAPAESTMLPRTVTSPAAGRSTDRPTQFSSAARAQPSLLNLGRQVSLPGAAVVDAITVTSAGRISWDRRSNVEYVFAAGPGGTDGKDAEVAVFASSSGFTASRVQGFKQVTVDGHRAWFGPVSTWPTNGRPDPQSGKQDSANPSLTWQLPNRRWLVLQSSAPTPTDPAALLHLAATLHIAPKSTPTRVPFRMGYVPAGFHSDDTASIWFEAGTSPKLLQSALTIVHGKAQITVSVSAPAVAPVAPLPTDGKVLDQRTMRGYVVAATSTGGASDAEVQKVLDGIQVADDPAHENVGWPTIEQVKDGS